MEGNELLNGRTNKNGEFSFKIPEIADLRIVLESSMGHGAEYLFKKSEFPPDQTEAAEIDSDAGTIKEPEAPIQVSADKDELRKEIEAALDAKLKPVIRELAKLREDKGPGVTEIAGGIGYILGIMGIVAYMKAGRK
jgi:nickel transport protein